MSSLPQFNPARIRSYILRLPFCTKILVAAILGLWIATIPFPWIRDFGGLEPNKMDLTQSTCFFGFGTKRGGMASKCGLLGCLGFGHKGMELMVRDNGTCGWWNTIGLSSHSAQKIMLI